MNYPSLDGREKHFLILSHRSQSRYGKIKKFLESQQDWLLKELFEIRKIVIIFYF